AGRRKAGHGSYPNLEYSVTPEKLDPHGEPAWVTGSPGSASILLALVDAPGIPSSRYAWLPWEAGTSSLPLARQCERDARAPSERQLVVCRRRSAGARILRV